MKSVHFILTMLLFVHSVLVSFGKSGTASYKRPIISGDLSFDFSKVEYWAINDQKLKSDYKYFMSLKTTLNPFKNYYFSFIFNYHLNQQVKENMPWLPDYSILFTRSKYTPNSFYWGYCNFEGNKYHDLIKDKIEYLSKGSFFVGYYLNPHHKIRQFVKLDSSSNILPFIQFSHAFVYNKPDGSVGAGIINGKPHFTVGIKYTIAFHFYVNFSAYYYLRKETQLPWASDYSYGFGYENWNNWRIRFAYLNYYNNKFPWNKGYLKSGAEYGDFMISLNYSF